MRINDARTGQRTEIRPRRAGLLRVSVDVGEQGHPFGFGDLRALLTADVLARTIETQGLQAVIELVVPDAPGKQTRALLKTADQLGIHPPAQLSARQEPNTSDQAVADLTITSRAHFHLGPPSVPLLVTGPVTASLNAHPDPGTDPMTSITAQEHDPLALRLTFLEHAVTAPIQLTPDTLSDASATLTRWRALVARLAYAPSRPLDADLVRASFDGLGMEMDARVALRALHALEDRTDLLPGTCFETCLRLDQILALELSRDVGRVPG